MTYRRNGLPAARGIEEMKQDHLEQLYQVADDADLEVLDRLGVKAGLIWICPVQPWNNPKGEPCGDCGRTEAEATAEIVAHAYEPDPRSVPGRTLAERGAMGHHGHDDFAACADRKHWDFVPQEVG